MVAGALTLWLWVMAVGRDLSWDVVNHHLYLPFSLLSGRYVSDFFGAGPQSYQNPVGYVPFYALVAAGLPSWAIGAALALTHSLVVWPLYRLAAAMWGEEPVHALWRGAALAMALSTPVFLLVLGTSSIDPIGAVLVLVSLALVVQASPSPWRMAVAGAGCGIAFAIKPTNSVFVLAMGAVLLLRCAAAQTRWRDALLFYGASLSAALVTMGPWSVWLWKTFGNPVFPLFNERFGSPFVPAEAIVALRFLPDSPWDLVARLWQIADYRSHTYIEGFAPDLRLPALVLIGVPAMVIALVRRGTRARLLQRADLQLAAFAAVSYALWMISSGNGRYAIPLFMIVGLLLVRAVQVMLPRPISRVFVLLILVLQTAYFASDGLHRLVARPWSREPYLVVHMPERLVDEPVLHLTLGVQSFAALALYMHHDGALINLVGQMSLPAVGPSGEAVRTRLDQWRGRTRLLFTIPDGLDATPLPEAVRRRVNRQIYRFGLRVNPSDCLLIPMLRALARESAVKSDDVPIVSCAAVARQRDDPMLDDNLGRVAPVFERLESQCRRILSPQPAVTAVEFGDVWQRHYINSDTKLSISPEKGVFMSHFRSTSIVRLGSIDDVMAGRSEDPCKAWFQLRQP